MKKAAKKKTKKKEEQVWTPEQIKKYCADAGFHIVFPEDKKPKSFGKSDDQLNKDTVIIPEGASRGFKVKV